MAKRFRYDHVGYWSEVKLDIIRLYAAAYSRILSAQRNPTLYHVYIDAFAGAGLHVSRTSGAFIPGSPLNALSIVPPFKEYFLIDLDESKVDSLRKLVGPRHDVHIFGGDCNAVLPKEVLPKVRYEDYRRGLCLLDPYGLHLSWATTEAVARIRTIEIFLNFPVADINRNVLLKNPGKVDPEDLARMDAYWGDVSWHDVAYTRGGLFGYEQKEPTETVAKAFQERLHTVAGFAHVPDPLPLRNSRGVIVYYLFFASNNPIAKQIVNDIFRKHGHRRA